MGTPPKGNGYHSKGEWVLLQRGMGTPPKGNGYTSKGEWVHLQRGNGYTSKGGMGTPPKGEWVHLQRGMGTPPKGEWIIRTHINYLYNSRSSLAVSTIACRAALVSGQWRVLSPQSGFTHSCSLGTTLMAFFIKSVISCCDGTRGE